MSEDRPLAWQTVRELDGEPVEFVGGTVVETTDEGWLLDVVLLYRGALTTRRVFVTSADIEAHRRDAP